MFSVPTLHGGLSKLILQDLPNLSFNGTIQKAILDQGSIYIGGSFTNITNITTKKSQNFTILNKDTSVISAISRIYFNSTVYCSAIDGDYIYIGGAFTSFNETAKNRIIKIHIPTGTIDSSFNIGSGFNNVLYSILVDGNDLYIGGSFTTYNSINRNYLAKINKNTGNLDTTFSIGTKLNGTVRTLAIDGDNLYVGGDFTTYNSLGRNRIIKIDKNTSNEISSFTIGTGFDNNVYSIKLDTDNVYVGGMFGFYKSTGRKYIAKISKADATLDTTFNTGTGFDYHVYSIELDGNDLYVGGGFSSYKSTTRQYIAKINKTDASLDTTFDSSVGFNNAVVSIALDGNNLYAGGLFTTYKGATRQYIAKINKNTALEIDSSGSGFSSTVGFDNAVRSIVVSGNNLYMGGDFTRYKNDSFFTRNYIVKINAVTKTVDPTFDPGTGFNTTVRALAIDGDDLYVGGDFISYKGIVRNYLAKINKNTANEIDSNGVGFSTDVGFDAAIYSLFINDSSVYMGGNFTTYKGTARKYIAKISKVDATLDSSFDTSSGFDNQVSSIVIEDNFLYASGFFTTYKGIARRFIAKINKNTAALDISFDTTTGCSQYVNSILLNQNDIYAVGNFTSYQDPSVTKSSYSALLDKADASLVSSVNKTTMDNSVYCSIQDGTYTYLGGAFTTYNGYLRNRIVKITTLTGEVDTTFDPGSGFNGIVRSLAIDGNNLYVGGSFTSYKGNPRAEIVKLDKVTANEVDTAGSNFSGGIGFSSGGGTGIRSLVIDNNNLYAAGDFTVFANNDIKKSERATLINKADASVSSLIPKSWCNGVVYCSVVDGDYIYVGGGFTVFNGFTANRVAKIHLPTGTVDTTFNIGTGFNANVFCLAIDGNNLYVGGAFTSYNGIYRTYLVKIDKNTALEVDSLGTGFSNNNFNGTVYSLAIDGNSLYAGGFFTSYKSLTRQYVVKIDKTTADFDTNFSITTGFNGTVYSLAIDGNDLYAGGAFTTYKGTTRQYIAKISKVNASLDTTFDSSSGFSSTVRCLAVDASGLYVSGDFITYKTTTTRQYIAKINKTDATLNTTFNTSSGFNSAVYSFVIDGDNLYAGGNFTSYKGLQRQYLAKIDKTTADEVDTNGTSFSTTTGFDNTVQSIVNTNYGLYIGGNFLSYKGNSGIFTRYDMVKINKTTAAEVDTNGTGFSTTTGFNGLVNSIAIDGNNLYIGGNFTLYKGSVANYLARIDKTNATEVGPYVTSMLNGSVNSLLIDQDSIYAGGNFNNVYDASSLRSVRAALVNKTDASFVSSVIKSYVGGTVYCSIVDGDYVYIGGDFNSYNDVFVNRIAKIYIPTGAIDTTFVASASFNNIVYTLAIDGDNLYAGGSFSSRLLKISKTTGSIDNGFAAYPSADVSSIAIDGNDLYVAGGFFAFNGKNIRYAVKINKTTGALDANDSFNISTRLGGVNCFYIDSTSIYMGGSFAKYVDLNSAKSLKGALISKTDASLVSSVIKSYFNDAVYCSVVDGNYIYVGGDFTIYNGTVRNRIAKINIQTGVLDTTFDPGSGFNSTVRCLAIDGTNLYVGGSFISYKGSTRQCIVKINKNTATEVDTDGTGFSTTTGFNGSVCSLAIDGTNLYAGGSFTSYQLITRQYVVKINKTTAAEVDTNGTGFSTTTGFNGSVLSLLVDGTNLYAGGSFTSYKGNNRYRLVKINKTTAAEVDTSNTGFSKNNQLDGSVASLLIDGTALYVAGGFNSYTDPSNSITSTRQNLMKINKDTGVLDTTFNTSSGFFHFYGSSISSIAVDGTNLYVGGYFSSYKSNSRQCIVKIDKTTANEVDTSGTGFSYGFGLFEDAYKSVLTISNTTYGLFVGGDFYNHKDEGLIRYNLVKINKLDATVDTAFNTSSGFSSWVNSIAVDGSNLYVGGDFNSYKSNSRQYIVKIDKTTANEVDTNGTGFSTTAGFNNPVRSILIDGTSLYAGGDFTTYKGTARTRMVKISKTDATLDATFDTSSGFNNTVYSVANTNYGIYGFGSFTLYKNDGNYTRQYLAKINKITSTVDTTFNTSSGFNGIVNSIVLDGNNLYAGGSFTTYKSLTRRYIAKIDKTTASEVDTSGTGFSTTTGFNNTIRSLTVSSNGLQAGGDFTNYKSNGLNTRDRVLKINKNTAALDSSFYVGVGTSGFNAEARCIVLIGDYLYIGGAFTSYASNTRQYIAKIHKDTAALNSTFNTISGFNNNVNDILVYTTDTIFTVGAFTTYKSASRNYNIFIETKDATVSPKKFKIG